MKKRIALLSLLGILGLLLALWRFAGDAPRGAGERSRADPEPARPVAAEQPLVPASAPPEDLPEEAPESSERVPIAASAPVDSGDRPAPARPETIARVHGRCVDGAGEPLAGAAITAVGVFGAPQIAAGEPVTGWISEADGSFEVAFDLGDERQQSRRLQFAHADLGTQYRSAFLRPGDDQDLGDVVLLPAGRVSGRVVDGHGRLLGGASVRVVEALEQGTRFGGPGNPLAAGEAGPNGLFRLENVAAGAVRVWAGQEDWQWSATEPLELDPGGELAGLELVLEPLAPEDTIQLIVLDPAGAPVPHAEVHYHYELAGRSESGWTQADERGRFRKFLDVRASYSFQANDPEGRYRPALARDVQPGVHDLVLQLGEKLSVRLRVEDERGAPVLRFRVRVVQPAEHFDATVQPPEDGSRAPGTVEIVVPPTAFELEVEAEGFEAAKLGPFAPDRMPIELVARLAALPGVRGRVTSAEGPLAGAHVSLCRATGADEIYVVNGFRCVSEQSAETEAVTDENGEYVLTLRRSGTWFVRAEAPPFAPADRGPLEIGAGVGASEIDLVLGRGGAIAGRVIVPAGEDPSGHIVGLSRGDGHGFTGQSDAQGEFHFGGLTPGWWQVVWRQDEISTSSSTASSSSGEQPGRIPWDCEVHEGSTTHFDLDLGALRVATLSGRFLLGGAALRDWVVTLSPHDDPELPDVSASLDQSGRFQLTLTKAGPYELELHGPLGAAFVQATTRIELVPGENAYEVDVAVGSLRGVVRSGELEGETDLELVAKYSHGILRPDPRASIRDRLELQHELVFRASLRAGSDGRFLLEGVPAGPASLEFRSAGKSGTKNLDIPKGGVAEVVVP